MLYNVTALQSQFYSSQNDLGPNVINQLSQVVYGENVPEVWGDFVTWPGNTHFGAKRRTTSPDPLF